MLRIAKPETPEQLEEYFDLRWRILRAPWDQLRGSEMDEFDEVADHVTVRDHDGRLVGIGRLHLNNEKEAQIRYMATEEDCRGLGIGRALIERLEELAGSRGVERIVLNARVDVVGFYQRFGYSVIGPGPTLFDKLKHSKMEKRLHYDNVTNGSSRANPA
jgi:predicted GNAT family N-acyltransferase